MRAARRTMPSYLPVSRPLLHPVLETSLQVDQLRRPRRREFRLPQHEASVPAVRRIPDILIRLVAAEEVELPRAFPDGLPDGMGGEHGSRTIPGKRRLEATQIVIPASPMGKTV